MSLTTNLISYWKFDSSNSNDSVGSNNGSDTNVTYSSGNGKIGIGAGLSRASLSNISIANGTATNLGTGDFSLQAWFKKAANGQYGGFLSTNNGDASGYGLTPISSNNIEFFIGQAGGGTDYLTSASTITDTNYHHVVVTRSGTALVMYIDGSSNNTSTAGGTRNVTNSQPLILGRYRANDAINNYFDGALDEVAVWSRALSGAEVTQLYNAGAGLQYPFVTSVNRNLLAIL